MAATCFPKTLIASAVVVALLLGDRCALGHHLGDRCSKTSAVPSDATLPGLVGEAGIIADSIDAEALVIAAEALAIDAAASSTLSDIAVDANATLVGSISAIAGRADDLTATLFPPMLGLAWCLLVCVGTIAALAGLAAAVYTALAVAPQLVSQAAARTHVAAALSDLASFYGALYYYIIQGGSYPSPHFAGNTQARCQVYSLALVYRMWSQPHYRNGDFHEDMVKNLRNVAIPGTGIPLSAMCAYKPVAAFFLLVGYPLTALVAGLNKHRGTVSKVAGAFSEQLLNPQDWFAFWQLNCRLATHHASVTGETDYAMEDKLEFLECAERNDIAVTPWMKTKKLIVKHRNEEGGLGFHAFDNCTEGGNWIIQEALDNDEFVSSLLPDEAPLSTFRVISASRGGLSGVEKGAAGSVQALSCVFRAGREGAITDHVSVLYDVDMKTGVIGEGTTNQHWYQLGLDKIMTCPWINSDSTTVHPDTDREVTGTKIPDMPGMIAFVEKAHARMMPGVPLAGWDVAYTNKGMLLLEANLSCNFFRGSFDKHAYFGFVDEYFTDLAEQPARAASKTA